MQQHGGKFCRRPPTPYRHHDPRGIVSKGHNSTFSEHGHFAYQIKGNHEFSNMVATILPAYTPCPHATLGIGSICQNSFFSEHGHTAS